MEIWKAITYVSTGLTLVAFIVATAAWLFRFALVRRENLIRQAPENKRAELVENALEYLRLNPESLTKKQRYDLALKQLHNKAARFSITAFVVMFIALLASGISIFALYTETQSKTPSVVPEPSDLKTVSTIGDSGGDGIQLLKDISIFDLRGWKQVPSLEINNRFSPVNYINYLHVKKTKPTNVYRAHYATSGVAIDLRCITHKYNVLLQATPIEHSGTNMKEYAVEINVENMPLDEEFLVVIEGTYWNSFQNLQQESASTYTDTEIGQLNELALVVLLPEKKPFKNYRLWYNPANSANKDVYGESSKFYADRDGKFIYWSIAERKKDYHYSVTWEW